jgi:hypothetical protein
MQNTDSAIVDWKFFATNYGNPVDARTDAALQAHRTENTDKEIFPRGTFGLVLFGETCQYKNKGNNAGKLFCGDKTILCGDDPAFNNLPLRGFPGDGGGKIILDSGEHTPASVYLRLLKLASQRDIISDWH